MPCEICETLIRDWLQLPLVKEDAYYHHVNQKILKEHSGELAREFYRLYANMSTVERFLIITDYEDKRREELKKYSMSTFLGKKLMSNEDTEVFNTFCRRKILHYIKEYTGDSDIDCIQALIEDYGIVSKDYSELWLGNWTMEIWKIIGTVHSEHIKEAPPGGGLTPGLRSFNTNTRTSSYR